LEEPGNQGPATRNYQDDDMVQRDALQAYKNLQQYIMRCIPESR
jgi:hypothetical protein